jgi:RNA polymerase sigma-70 factor (ECF subfamily)
VTHSRPRLSTRHRAVPDPAPGPDADSGRSLRHDRRLRWAAREGAEHRISDATDPTDEDLVRRVRAGDEAAARLLFERHAAELRAKARARLPAALRGKVAESDVIQDAWLAAFLALGKFEDRGDGSFGRWLRGIVEHKIREEAGRHLGARKRDARRDARLLTDEARSIPSPDQPSPSEAAAAGESAADLRRVIESLPEDHATVLRLVYLDGLTLAEAGERMCRSADAVRKTYGRALARLAEKVRGRRSTLP